MPKNMLLKRLHTKDIVALSIFIAVFVMTSFLSLIWGDQLKALVQIQGIVGMVSYVAITMISDVIGPITAVPLIPIAVTFWGSIATAVLSITGWTIGAMIVFWLTRRFGKPLVAKIMNIERVEEVGRAIPEKKFFWIVVFFRMIFPVDILSYALGLFTNMHWLPYLVSTMIGIAPFAFVLSYGVTLPIQYQALAAMVVLIALVFIYGRARRRILNWIKK